ncbi:MAG: acyl carrier protein [Nevskia sp.]|nr:acyl carrier protein [Nevskia sp.]
MSDTLERIKQLVSKYSKNKEALAGATGDTAIQQDLGVSSINLVDIVLALEDAFDVTIADEDLMKLRTLGDAARMIEELQARGGKPAAPGPEAGVQPAP